MKEAHQGGGIQKACVQARKVKGQQPETLGGLLLSFRVFLV